jgi:hypothetical protein
MAFLNPSNQLIQIDTGSVLTYLFNPAVSQVPIYANLGENQVLGQRYVGYNSVGVSNPYGAPAIYMLVKYLATSATTLANWQTPAAPAPVYWADNTFTTVTGIFSEAYNSLGAQMVAGYWMPNTVSLPNATLAQLLGGVGFIQVAGFLPGGWGPTATPGAGFNITGSTGNFTSTGSASAPAGRTLGVQLTTIASSVCNILVNCDLV